jgi:hypothetical protein
MPKSSECQIYKYIEYVVKKRMVLFITDLRLNLNRLPNSIKSDQNLAPNWLQIGPSVKKMPGGHF